LIEAADRRFVISSAWSRSAPVRRSANSQGALSDASAVQASNQVTRGVDYSRGVDPGLVKQLGWCA
jgi:hypothetical protein